MLSVDVVFFSGVVVDDIFSVILIAHEALPSMVLIADEIVMIQVVDKMCVLLIVDDYLSNMVLIVDEAVGGFVVS